MLQFNFTVNTVDYWGIRWHQLHLNEIRQCVRGVLIETRKNPWSQIPIIIQWCYWWRSLSGNNWLQKVITDQLESNISREKKWTRYKKRERSCFSSSNTMSTLAYLFHSRRTTKPKCAKCIPRIFLSHSKDNVLFSCQQMNGNRCDGKRLVPARNI